MKLVYVLFICSWMVLAVWCLDTQLLENLALDELESPNTSVNAKSPEDLMREADELQKIADDAANVLLKYKEIPSTCKDCERSKLALQQKIRLDQAAALDAQRAADEARNSVIKEQVAIQKKKDDSVKSLKVLHQMAVDTLDAKLFDLGELYKENVDKLMKPGVEPSLESELKHDIDSRIDEATAAYFAVEKTGTDYKGAMTDAEAYSEYVIGDLNKLVDRFLASIQGALFDSVQLKAALTAKINIASHSPDNISLQNDVDIAQSLSDNAKLAIENLQRELVEVMEYFISSTRGSVARSYENANEFHRLTAEAESFVNRFISNDEAIAKQVRMIDLVTS
jgi:hypothetical protein